VIKIVTLFLIAVIVLAILGRIRLPKKKLNSKCESCGSFILNDEPCLCGKKFKA